MGATRTNGGASTPPLSLALSMIPNLPRPLLSRLVARAIDRLDEIDGDPDAEQTGDEAEPDFAKLRQGYGYGVGCAVSDPDFGIEDVPEGDCASVDHRPIADPQAYREHRARIRKTRCYQPRRDRYEWDFYFEPVTPTKRQLLRRKRGLPRMPRA